MAKSKVKVKDDIPTSKRIHIGNISPKLSDKPESLTSRFEKFGKIVTPLELRTKPLNDLYFGFMTMELTQKNWENLKRSLNGILFMGLKLDINLAKRGNFEHEWERDAKRVDRKKDDRIKQENIQRARNVRIAESQSLYPINPITQMKITNPLVSNVSGYHKSEHTFNNLSGNTKHKPPTHSLKGLTSYSAHTIPTKLINSRFSNVSGKVELIKGRHRVTKRSASVFIKKLQTMRILINGEVKQIKAFKTKLWGIEKNKTVNDLTWRFNNGVWKSGDDHNIEILKPPPCGISGMDAVNYGKVEEVANVDQEEISEEGVDINKETLKNKSVLASLFDKFDFDKPVEVEEDTLGIDKEDIIFDSKGRRKVKRYDYEVEGGENDDNEDDEEDEFKVDVVKADEIIKTFTETHERPKDIVYYSEDDEGNDLDLDLLGQQYTTEAINKKYNAEHDFEVVKNEPAKEPENEAEGEFEGDVEDAIEEDEEEDNDVKEVVDNEVESDSDIEEEEEVDEVEDKEEDEEEIEEEVTVDESVEDEKDDQEEEDEEENDEEEEEEEEEEEKKRKKRKKRKKKKKRRRRIKNKNKTHSKMNSYLHLDQLHLKSTIPRL